MLAVSRGQVVLCLAIALLVHGSVGLLMVNRTQTTGAEAPGLGGQTIGFGALGGVVGVVGQAASDQGPARAEPEAPWSETSDRETSDRETRDDETSVDNTTDRAEDHPSASPAERVRALDAEPSLVASAAVARPETASPERAMASAVAEAPLQHAEAVPVAPPQADTAIPVAATQAIDVISTVAPKVAVPPPATAEAVPPDEPMEPEPSPISPAVAQTATPQQSTDRGLEAPAAEAGSVSSVPAVSERPRRRPAQLRRIATPTGIHAKPSETRASAGEPTTSQQPAQRTVAGTAATEGVSDGANRSAQGGDPGAKRDYGKLLRQIILSSLRYPRRARARRQEGIGRLHISVDEAGRVLAASVQSSAGYPLLDKEMRDMVARAAPFPKPSADMGPGPYAYTIAIAFQLR